MFTVKKNFPSSIRLWKIGVKSTVFVFNFGVLIQIFLNKSFCSMCNMQKITNIAILASGSGTNAQRIMEHFSNHDLARVVLVASENADAYALVRAQRFGVEAVIFSVNHLRNGRLLQLLQEYEVDFVVLAGFLKLVPTAMVEAFSGRMLNIHPALLPNYGGKGMFGHHVHEAVIAHGEQQSGITIHYVNGAYDSGDTVFQATCPVLPNDTPDTLAKRIHQLEHQYFPLVIEGVIRGERNFKGLTLNI